MGRALVIAFQQSFLSRFLPCALALGGCAPEIGDNCETSLDCSPAGDRLCDVTQPGGYCTIYNCEDTTEDEANAPQGACPEEAACVIFAPTPSAQCEDAEGDVAYQRTFCMFRCKNSTDCRTEDGYQCRDLTDEKRWHAVVIDRRPEDERRDDGPIKVCTQPYDGAVVPDDRSTDVCTGTSHPSDG